MKGISFLYLFFAIFLIGCSGSGNTDRFSDYSTEDRIMQLENGLLILNVNDADCYSDMDDPSVNTAEWNAVIVKSGRYDIWLSSATLDTTSLNYSNSVHLNFNEINLDAHPRCDRIAIDSELVTEPYFQADSYIGTVYIPDTGFVDVQFISEQILPEHIQFEADSRFMSLYFTPETMK